MTYTRDELVGLRWTGHPLIDMGVAGLTVFAQKRNPEEVTGTHLEEFVTWAEIAYQTKEMEYFVQQAFGRNRFFNASHTPQQRQENISDALRSYTLTDEISEVRCTFFSLPAQKLVARDLLPMLTGQGMINFYPDGLSGLPLSGLAITVIQALSLAAPIVSNRILVIAPDDKRLLLGLVKQWQSIIRNRVQISAAVGEKRPIWSNGKTRLIDEFIKIEKSATGAEYEGGVTIFHASNSGRDDSLAIYTIEHTALRFVQKAQTIKFAEAWSRLTRAAWTPAKKDNDEKYATYNSVYEALFDLPLEAGRFISRFFRRPIFDALKVSKPATPTKASKKKTLEPTLFDVPDSPSVSSQNTALWDLLELFLQEVLGMERTRVERIRTLGDRLAGLVNDEKDKRLFQQIYTTRFPNQVRALLLKVSMRQLKNNLEPAVRFDEYLSIFEEGEELARADFGLAWDLTKMRFIEQLFEKKFFETNKEVLDEIDTEDEMEKN